MKGRSIFLLLGSLALLLAGVLPGAAQTVTGTMGGHVGDSSGGMMPNVKVVAKNEQTQGVREATTNTDGYYLITFLTRNPSNFVNSGRTVGSRMGQLAIRVVF